MEQLKYKKRVRQPTITAVHNQKLWELVSLWLDNQPDKAGTKDQLKVVTCPSPGFVVYAIGNNWLVKV